MFSTPCSAAPTMSAWIASRFLSRQTTCRIGSMPSACSAIATATLEACACAAVLSVALTASTHGSYCSSFWRTASMPAAVDHGQLARDHEAARPPACARARTCLLRRPRASSPRASAGRACSAKLAHEDVFLSRLSTGGRMWLYSSRQCWGSAGHVIGALVALQPHAAHLGLDLAVPVRAHAPAGPVAQRLRAVHRAGHARSSAARTGRTSGSPRSGP